MRIHTSITLDMESGATLHEEGFDYDGPVALCLTGGGGGTTTIEPDREYNARMATIAEAQQALSEQLQQYWAQVTAPYETSVTESDSRLLPYSEASDYADYLSKLSTIGDSTNLEKAQIASQQYLLPQQTNLESLNLAAQQTALPYQMQNAITKLAADTYLIPQQTNLTSAQVGAQQYLLPSKVNTAKEFFNATSPTSTAVQAGRAVSDVNMGYKQAEDTLNRSLNRMGVSGSAATGAMKDLATNRALSLAGAANTGRNAAEEENYNKLATGMQYAGL